MSATLYGMPYDPIQGQDHRGPKLQKWLISKYILYANKHVIKITNGEF